MVAPRGHARVECRGRARDHSTPRRLRSRAPVQSSCAPLRVGLCQQSASEVDSARHARAPSRFRPPRRPRGEPQAARAEAVMDRRAFLGMTALLVAPCRADAQPIAKVPRIAFLGNSTAALEANLVGPFREGLRDLGYTEGKNIVLEYRWAEGRYERFPALIAELLALKVDVIVTAGTPGALAVRRVTTAIPLVMVAVGDPVGSGLVKSLARTGGSLTGLVSAPHHRRRRRGRASSRGRARTRWSTTRRPGAAGPRRCRCRR